MSKLELAGIATDEQPELSPGTRVNFLKGHNPEPETVMTGTILAPDRQWLSVINQQFVLIAPDARYVAEGWPKSVIRRKTEITPIL